MRKLIAGFVSATMVIGAIASAERVSVLQPVLESDVVTVSGSVPESFAGQNVAIQVIKPGGTVGNLNDIFQIREIKSNEDGSFLWSFSMPEKNTDGESTTGSYSVYAGAKGLESSGGGGGAQSFFYYSPKDREVLIKKIDSETEKSSVSALLGNENNKRILSQLKIFYDVFFALSPDEQNAIIGKLISEEFVSGGVADELKFTKIFNDAIILELINKEYESNGLRMEAIKPFGEYIEIDFKKYDEIKNSDHAELFNKYILDSMGNGWNKIDAFREKVSEAYALVDINSVSVYKDMWKTVERYLGNVITFNAEDLQYYKSLESETDIYTINKALTNQDFQTIDAIKEAFSKAIKELMESKKNQIERVSGADGGIATVPTEMVPSNLIQQNPFFNDVAETYWAYECLKVLKQKGVLSGDEHGNFNPEQTLTREIFVTMLVLGMNLPVDNGDTRFSDVSKDAWYSEYVKSAEKANITRGISEECFGVGAEISRQDMSVMIYRAAKYKGIKLAEEYAENPFADDSNIGFYAREAVYILRSNGIISGIDEKNFAPLARATKAQAAILIYKLINAM